MRIRYAVPATAVFALAFTSACSGNVDDLAVGQCWNDASQVQTEISDVATVECSEPHDNEVAFVGTLDGDDYPGDAEIVQQAQERCATEVANYVDADLDALGLLPYPLYPSEDSWNSGSHKLICSVYQASLEKITGPVSDLANG
jgi:hypothetical protein